MSKPFSSPFHRDDLMRTKNYAASSLFSSSFTFKKSQGANWLTEVFKGPIDPDGPAAPDGTAIVVGIVSESKLRVGPLGNWTTDNNYNKPIQDAKYTFLIVKPNNDLTFAPDFPITIAALKRLQTTVSKTGDNKWFIEKDDAEDVIRFAFTIFETKDKNPDI
ncbi:hypothetical protein B0H13DRAFT_2368677 [Mycena leptocephala]|nr:hypothetical protein B0H13DRAFT_2368677 [Mycena leptocephala]